MLIKQRQSICLFLFIYLKLSIMSKKVPFILFIIQQAKFLYTITYWVCFQIILTKASCERSRQLRTAVTISENGGFSSRMTERKLLNIGGKFVIMGL